MSTPDDDRFDDLAREFQEVDRTRETLEVLRGGATRGRRRMIASFGVMLLIGAFLTTVALLKLWRDRDAAAIAFAVLEIGVPILLIRNSWREQRNTWRAASETTRGFIELEVARQTAIVRTMTFLRRLSPLMGFGALVFQVLVVRKTPAAFFDRPLLGFSSLAGAYVILAGVYWYAGVRLRRSMKRRAALEAELAASAEVTT